MAAFFLATTAAPQLIPLSRTVAFLPVALSSYARQSWLPGISYTALFAFTFLWHARWAGAGMGAPAEMAGALTSSLLLLGVSLILHTMAVARANREHLAAAARERGELLARAASFDRVAAFICEEAMADLGAEAAGLLVRNPLDDRWEFYAQETLAPVAGAGPGAPMGLATWLARRHQETVIDDLWTDGRFAQSGRWRSLLAKPLRTSQGDLLATLVLAHSYPGQFGPEDVRALERLASAAESALGHAGSYERAGQASEELTRQLAAIQRTARELNAELEPEAIAARTLDCAVELAEAAAGAIRIEVAGMRPLIRSSTGRLGGVVNQVLAETSEAARPRLEESLEEGLLIPKAGSRMLVPIRRGSMSFGAILLEKTSAGRFTTRDFRAVASLIHHAAVALENTRLFAQITAEREKSQQIVQNITDGVLTLDSNLRIRSLNPAAERLLARTAIEAQASPFCELLHCGDVPCPGSCPRLDRMLAGEQGPERTWRRRADGEGGPLLKLSVGPLLLPERGAVVLLHDVTREEELARFQRELVSTFSHELRSPLANISAVADLLLDAGGPGQGGRWRELVELLRQQSQRLAGLAERTLDVARLEDGQWRLELRPLPAALTAQDAVERWRNVLPGRVICLEASAEAGWAWGDEVAVNTVLDNLIDNAAKYSPAGATITVRVEAAQAGSVAFAVEDQGQGIAPDERPRLFQRFFRGDASDSQRIYGYGLGLYVSQRLVQAMGGRIWVEPGLQGGSRFAFTLPVRKEDERETPDSRG